MVMDNLIVFVVTVVPTNHGEVLPQKTSKQSRFVQFLSGVSSLKLSSVFYFLQKLGKLVNVIANKG